MPGGFPPRAEGDGRVCDAGYKMKLDLALPLFCLVDREKVDPDSSDLSDLAHRLGAHLEESFSIHHETVSIEGGAQAGKTPVLYLVLHGVPQSSWPAFVALCQAQRAVPLHFRADAETGRFTLTPIGERG